MGAKTEGWKADNRGGDFEEWAATPSPLARSAASSPGRVWGGAPTVQRFPLFSALRMASPDTIVLLIVDHAATTGGGADPRGPLAYDHAY